MVTIIQGDCREVLKTLPDPSVNCCVTSPPYWGLRDYGVAGQLGLERTPEEYVANLVAVFREVRRVLRDDGTVFLNLADSYANDEKWGGSSGGKHVKQLHGPTGVGRRSERGHSGLKPKDLVGIPWRMAFALQADGWWLRQDIIWAKPNPMPESVTDRCTKSHEYIFLLAKSKRYYYDAKAVAEPSLTPLHGPGYTSFDPTTMRNDRTPGNEANARLWGSYGIRNQRSVWTVATQPYPGAHFATYPPELIRPCILAGCPQGGTVLDPFAGSGTTGEVAEQEGRNSILIELNPEYVELAKKRTAQQGLFCASGPTSRERGE